MSGGGVPPQRGQDTPPQAAAKPHSGRLRSAGAVRHGAGVTVLAAEMLQASGKREPPVNEASGDAVRRIEVSGGSGQRSITDGQTLGELTEMLEGLTMGDADGSDCAQLPPAVDDAYTITMVTHAGQAAVYRLAGDRLTDETAGKTVCLSDKQAQELLALLEPAQ